jgi:hypothetical protein
MAVQSAKVTKMTVQKSSSPSVHFGQFDQIVQFRNYLSNLSKVDEVNSPESVSEYRGAMRSARSPFLGREH